MDSAATENIMKRYGGLYPDVCAFENVYLAARKAQRSKRYRDDVLAFNHDLEDNLLEIQEALKAKTYAPGPYKTFVIYEPKRRLISAAPYRDRVVHHGLCNVIEPLFDRAFIHSSYANRRGKGTHKALDHFVKLGRRYRYCLRADVEKYFPSMDHAVLKAKIRRKIKCRCTLWLIDLILDNSNEQEPVGQYFDGDELLTPCERRHGLPIGNLTSQLWANVYLNDTDHTMAEMVGGRRYIRYVDDFALFSDDKTELLDARAQLAENLAGVRLRLHPVKTEITEMKQGVNFLGFRIFPDRIRLRQENLRRARKRMRGLERDYRLGKVDWPDVKNALQSWGAHAAYGDTWRLRHNVFGALAFVRG
jgi:retron-type reverse transcriptase